MADTKQIVTISGAAHAAVRHYLEEVMFGVEQRIIKRGSGHSVSLTMTKRQAELLLDDLKYRYSVRRDIDPELYQMHYACKAAAERVEQQLAEWPEPDPDLQKFNELMHQAAGEADEHQAADYAHMAKSLAFDALDRALEAGDGELAVAWHGRWRWACHCHDFATFGAL